MRLLAVALLAAVPALSAQLKPETLAAFDRYVRQAEQRLDEHKGRLWVDESPNRARRIERSEVVVEPLNPKPLTNVPGGLIHDWVGGIFLPGVGLDRTLALVRDYDRHKQYFKPEVADSRILEHDGDHYLVYLRLLKKQIITVVLDTEHDVRYERLDESRWQSVSRSTKIAEVENPGKRDERERPPGTGEGFLWRLNSYWRFQERGGGTWVECEAISLTRDIPAGLGWLIEPIIRSLPRDSVANTLRELKAALAQPR
jgi:hypothetical protein